MTKRIIHQNAKGEKFNFMQYEITPTIVIDDVDIVTERLKLLTNCENEPNMNTIAQFIHNEKATIFYLDETLAGKSSEESKKIKYVWLDSGYRLSNNDPIFIALIYYPQEEIAKGHYVGTCSFLSRTISNYTPRYGRKIKENIKKFLPKYSIKTEKRTIPYLVKQKCTNKNLHETKEPDMTEIPDETKSITISSSFEQEQRDKQEENVAKEPMDIAKEMFSNLLYPFFQNISGLDLFLKDAGTLIKELVEAKRDEYYVMNNMGNVIVNTGIMDLYGTDFYILYKPNLKYQTYSPYYYIRGKKDYLLYHFTKEDSCKELKPINFNYKNDVFDAKIEDFDIDYHTLGHIIEDRNDRFPVEIQTLPASMIANKLKNALERGIKMQERDHTFVKPVFSSSRSSISWVMPFHVQHDFNEKPELVMVLRKAKDFWEIKTILAYDERLKDKIASICLYQNLW